MNHWTSWFGVFGDFWDAGLAYVERDWLVPVNGAACGLISIEALMMMVFTLWRNTHGRLFVKALYAGASFCGFTYVVVTLTDQTAVVGLDECALHVFVALIFAELVLGWRRRYLIGEAGL